MIELIVLIGAGGFVFWLLSIVSKFFGLLHKTEDYKKTMDSKSRDPLAHMTTLQQQRSLNRWKAAAFATILVLLALILWRN